jgi:hypothetical protein
MNLGQVGPEVVSDVFALGMARMVSFSPWVYLGI